PRLCGKLKIDELAMTVRRSARQRDGWVARPDKGVADVSKRGYLRRRATLRRNPPNAGRDGCHPANDVRCVTRADAQARQERREGPATLATPFLRPSVRACHPTVIAGGRLYIRESEDLFVYDLHRER